MPSPPTAPGRSSRGLRTGSTLLTGAEDRQVADVHDERVLLTEPLSQRRQHIWVNGDDAVTIPADQVEMLVLGDRVVGRGAIAQVGVAHQTELLEHLQRA